MHSHQLLNTDLSTNGVSNHVPLSRSLSLPDVTEEEEEDEEEDSAEAGGDSQEGEDDEEEEEEKGKSPEGTSEEVCHFLVCYSFFMKSNRGVSLCLSLRLISKEMILGRTACITN